jgi:hypothetical protein
LRAADLRFTPPEAPCVLLLDPVSPGVFVGVVALIAFHVVTGWKIKEQLMPSHLCGSVSDCVLVDSSL